MVLIREDLPVQAELVQSNNSLSSYFPIRTENNNFDWDSALGYVVKTSYRKELKNIDVETFKQTCENRFKSKLDEEKFWNILEEMYFQNGELFKISPEFLLFKTQRETGKTANARLGSLFASLLQNFFFDDKPNTHLNFIEKQLYNELLTHIKTTQDKKNENSDIIFSNTINESPYLPFLATHFQQDLRFLGKRPKYLLSVFKEYLRLYAHLYTAQLALNIKDWRAGEPKAKPNYYIVDSEKASNERSLVNSYGYKQFDHSLWGIFPYLAMNESLQEKAGIKQPIWKIAQSIKSGSESAHKLKQYSQAFKQKRGLESRSSDSSEPLDQLDILLKLAEEELTDRKKKRKQNESFTNAIKNELCNHFVQIRGRAGRVLVLNQDYLILLTNLAIGEQDKLRFHELIKAFESKGVFFDKLSQQVLIEFYERIGNVERMSDSGDAVYVRKTI